MQTQTVPKNQLMRLMLAMLVLCSGLCTIFASMVTAAQAWQEHAQERWPEVTAHVDTCGLEQTSTGVRRYYIRCRLSYAVGVEQNVATIYSRNAPSPEVWQYPRNQIGPLEQWVDEHPPGTPILVRYDPAKHTKVVSTDSLVGGPHTQSNIKVLEVCAVSFVILLAVARITRSRSLGKADVPHSR
jgi:uncharacterized protein DUF3592